MGRIHAQLSLVIIVSTCLTCSAVQTPTVDDYEIYAAFFNQNRWERTRLEEIEVRTLVVANVTSVYELDPQANPPWDLRDTLLENLPRLELSTIQSFELRNRHPGELSADRFEEQSVVLVPKAELRRIFGGGGWWSEFYSRYPHAQGHLSLSRVGISSDGKQTLLYYGNQWGANRGVGEFVVFERNGNGWRISDRWWIWVS